MLNRNSTYRIIAHVAGWLIFFIIPFLISPARDVASLLADGANVGGMLIRNVFWMGLFYLNLLYLTPIVLKKKGISLFVVVSVAAILMVTIINSRLHPMFAPAAGFPDEGMPPRMPFRRPPPLDFGGPFFSNFLVSLTVVTAGTTIVLWSDWLQARADEQTRSIEKLTSELAVLKLQISPHFLFNTLNNIRWLIRSRSEHAEEGVVKLSQLLRYILYRAQDDMVSLREEVDHLADYVELQRMRLSNLNAVSFSTSGDAGTKVIVPLLFIPIVENVFKHGDFTGTVPGRIELLIDKDRVTLRTSNAILQQTEPAAGSGIGLSNVRKRLALHYPDKHLIHVSSEHGIYSLELQIILIG